MMTIMMILIISILESSRVFSTKEEALKSIKTLAIVVDPIVVHLAINFVRFRRFDSQEN